MCPTLVRTTPLAPFYTGPRAGHIDAPHDVRHVTSNGTFTFGWGWSLPHVNASASHNGQETIRATSNETFGDTANAPDEDLPSLPSIANELHVGPGAASATPAINLTPGGHVEGERYLYLPWLSSNFHPVQ